MTEAVLFTIDDKVTITDPKDRYYGESGQIMEWYHGMGGGRLYWVTICGMADPLVFTESQLDLGENLG